MADIVPVAYNPWHLSTDPIGDTPYNAGKAIGSQKLQILTFYFSDADSTELFIPPRGTLACAWQPATITAGTLVTTTIGSTGIVFTGGTNALGWLHCAVNGSASTGSTTDQAPVSRGTAGYVNPQTGIFFNHKSASPNTLTSASAQHRIQNKLGLKLRFFAMPAVISNADVWKCTTLNLCRGIVAVAWQPGIAAEDVIVSLNANGDVLFTTSTGSTEIGFLWAWSRG